MPLPTTPLAPFACALAACALLAAPPAMAARRPPPATSMGQGMHSPHPGVAKGVLRTAIGVMQASASDLELPVNAGVELDTDHNTRFTCTAEPGCTVIAETMASLWTEIPDNDWSMCVYVDDVRINNTCLLQGPLTENRYRVGVARGSVSVAKGRHVIRTTVWTFADAILSAYEHSYQIVSP